MDQAASPAMERWMPRTRSTPQSSPSTSSVTMRFTRFDDDVVIPSPSGRPDAQDVGQDDPDSDPAEVRTATPTA